MRAETPKILPGLDRCGVCGSPDIDFEGWHSYNLPINMSESGSDTKFCNACESLDFETIYSDTREEQDNLLEEWVAYRMDNGLDSLEDADRDFIANLESSIEASGVNTQRAKRLLADLRKEQHG